MPRLSDYLLVAQNAPATTQPAPPPPTSAALPLQTPSIVSQPPAPPQPSTTPTTTSTTTTTTELARLQQQHTSRLRQRGPRLYRQPDGSLASSAPDRNPYTVAARSKWHGLVQHCRQQPGVNAQLTQTGQSARYGVSVPHPQHVAALAAAGLTPEFDEAGVWHGHQPGVSDPLTDAGHSLRHGEWSAVTRAVLQRAVDVHGEATLEVNQWDVGLY